MNATLTNEDMALLANTPALRSAREQLAAERLGRRKAAVDEIRLIEGELGRLVPQADKTIVEAQKGVESARVHLRSAETRAREADHARSSIVNPREHRRDVLLAELRNTASPQLDAALERNRRLREEMSRPGALPGAGDVEAWSALKGRLARIDSAWRELDELRTAALDDDDLAKRIAEAEASIDAPPEDNGVGPVLGAVLYGAKGGAK